MLKKALKVQRNLYGKLCCTASDNCSKELEGTTQNPRPTPAVTGNSVLVWNLITTWDWVRPPNPNPSVHCSGSNSQVCPNNFYGSPYLFCPGNQTYSSCVREDYKSWWCSTTANELAECDDQKCPLEAWGKLLIITSQMEVALAKPAWL